MRLCYESRCVPELQEMSKAPPNHTTIIHFQEVLADSTSQPMPVAILDLVVILEGIHDRCETEEHNNEHV